MEKDSMEVGLGRQVTLHTSNARRPVRSLLLSLLKVIMCLHVSFHYSTLLIKLSNRHALLIIISNVIALSK